MLLPSWQDVLEGMILLSSLQNDKINLGRKKSQIKLAHMQLQDWTFPAVHDCEG